MLNNILGVAAGFVVWTILLFVSEAVIRAVAPSIAPSDDISHIPAIYLVIKLVLSAILSIISGYAAALVTNGNSSAALSLGILLLLIGIFVEAMYWQQIPIWYHIPFLLLLVPMTILGGKLKKQSWQ